jgi:phage shock protein B
MNALEAMIPLSAILGIFVGMPWLVLHYVTKWKQAKSITVQDEDLLDELHDIARRLDERMNTVERLIAVDRADPPLLGQMRSDLSNVELHPQLRRKDQAQ